MNVVEFPTAAVTERRSVNGLVAELAAQADAGHVRQLLVAYVDGDGAPRAAVSSGMTLASLAYLIELLRQKLQRWMAE